MSQLPRVLLCTIAHCSVILFSTLFASFGPSNSEHGRRLVHTKEEHHSTHASYQKEHSNNNHGNSTTVVSLIAHIGERNRVAAAHWEGEEENSC